MLQPVDGRIERIFIGMLEIIIQTKTRRNDRERPRSSVRRNWKRTL